MMEYGNMEKNDQNLIHLVLQKFLPFWPLFLILVLLGLGLANAFLTFTTPKFETTAALVINDEKKGVDESQLMESFNVFESNKIVENEIEVLQSKDILHDVVRSLNLYAPVYKDKLIGAQAMFNDAPIKVVARDPTNVGNTEEGNKVGFQYLPEKEAVLMNNSLIPLNTWVDGPFGGSEIMFKAGEATTADDKEEFFFELHDPRAVVDGLLGNLTVVAASKLSTVVNISYVDSHPERGNAIVDQLIGAYRSAAVESQNSLASNTLNFIDERIAEVGDQLIAVEKDLEKYRSAEGVIDLGQQGNLYLQNVGEYDRRIAEIKLQLSVLGKVEAYVVSKQTATGIVPSTLGVNDPILSELLQRLYDAEIEYQELSKTTAENNPILVSVRNRIAQIRPSILENVRSQKANLLASRQSLTSNSGKYSEALNVLPEQERKFVEISRKKKSVSDLYDFLVQKREETALSLAPTAGNVRVIQKAEASVEPVFPKSMLVYLIGALLPLFLGILWVAGRELFNTRVLFRSELEEAMPLPIVGELSYLKKAKKQVLVSEHRQLYILDQFRRLLSNLGMFDQGTRVKTLLVTSSIVGEGKSYVSANLAMTLSLSGIKTALVDMDLRKGTVSRLFGHNGKEGGISTYLTEGKRSGLQYQVNDNLSLFPSGESNTNSTALLVGGAWKDFITELKADFEAIIIDSPPTSLVTDATLLAQHADKTAFVVRHAHTPKFVLKHLGQTATGKGFEESVVIFNALKGRGLVKKGYGYGYGYEALTPNAGAKVLPGQLENVKTIRS
ncbi:GumC family protein [Maribacter sp. 2307ULW6-5]|uniref:GumC family protein n=1 Tax=Maribacter sp. 2307ULW6-5 TaxID=3386275 RepID=UPI0039BD23E0